MGGGYGTGHGGGHHYVEYERWYGYGLLFGVLMAGLAVAQTIYAIYMGLSGAGGMGGAH